MSAPRLNKVFVPEDWNRPTPDPDSDTETVKIDTVKRSVEDGGDDCDVDEGYASKGHSMEHSSTDSWIQSLTEKAKRTSPKRPGHHRIARHSIPDKLCLISHDIHNKDSGESAAIYGRDSIRIVGQDGPADELKLCFTDFYNKPSLDLILRGEEAACSRSSSIDSDMVSIPDSVDHSTALESMPLDHRDIEVVGTVSNRLFNGFSLVTFASLSGSRHESGYSGETRDASDEESPPQHNGSTHVQSSYPVHSTIPTRGSPKKRKQRDKEQSDDERGDARDRRGPKRPAPPSREDSPRKLLACPFWKRDARQHRDCFKLRLDGIARVKQHLSRSHYWENHCERCKHIFASHGAREDHLRHEQCQWRGPDALVGITHKQRNDLSRKSKPHHSESEKWFAVWEIVFPGQLAPSCPYMDPDLSQDLSEFRMYTQTHGARIVEEELGRHGLFVDSQGSEWFQTLLRAALSRGQDMVFETWLAGHASPTGTPGSLAQPASSHPRGSPTPAQSLDSGVALGTQGGPSTTPDYMRINGIDDFGAGRQLKEAGSSATDNQDNSDVDQTERLPLTSDPGPIAGLGDFGEPTGNDIDELFGFDIGFDQNIDLGDFSFV